MAKIDWKLVCRLVHSACIVLGLWGGAVLAAEAPALIKNRPLAVGIGKEVDASVSVVAIDARPVVDEESDVEVAPGRHEIEVACTARVFVGMGTVDFPSKSVLTIEVQSGRVYRLDAKVTVQGDCTPVLE